MLGIKHYSRVYDPDVSIKYLFYILQLGYKFDHVFAADLYVSRTETNHCQLKKFCEILGYFTLSFYKPINVWVSIEWCR